jgi:hypothetical protein
MARGAQFVGSVGCESLLFGDVCFEPLEHGVEGVGEFTELVLTAFQLDPVGERPLRSHARGVCDTSQRGEHPASEQPPSEEPEHEQEDQHHPRSRREVALQDGALQHHPPGKDPHIGQIT